MKITNQEAINLFVEMERVKESDCPEEEKQKRIAESSNKIITGTEFLVRSKVKKYKRMGNYEDLVQEGFIGLIKATQRFNYKLFPNFFVYAERWINGFVKRAASRFDIVHNPNKVRVLYIEDIDAEDTIDEEMEDRMLAKDAYNKIVKVLDRYPARDQSIVKCFYGIDSYYGAQTLRDMAPKHGLTHEGVRQIKNKIVEEIKNDEIIKDLVADGQRF